MEARLRRKAMWTHCLFLLERAGDEYAMTAADWYEANEPWSLYGLGARMRQEVESRQVKRGRGKR